MEEIGIFDHPVQQEVSAPLRVTTTTTASSEVEEDLYMKYKKLQRQIEFLQVRNNNYTLHYND